MPYGFGVIASLLFPLCQGFQGETVRLLSAFTLLEYPFFLTAFQQWSRVERHSLSQRGFVGRFGRGIKRYDIDLRSLQIECQGIARWRQDSCALTAQRF